VGREISCPDCNQTISITTDDEDRVVVKQTDSVYESVQSSETQIRLPKPASKTGPVLRKFLTLGCWSVILLLSGLIGFGLLSQGPNQTGPPPKKQTQVEEKQEVPREPTPELFPEVTETTPEPQPPEETEPASPVPEEVQSEPVSDWKFSGRPPINAERPLPPKPVWPVRWEELMTLPILEYRVEAIPLPALLDELQQLAGSEFQYSDEKVQAIVEDEKTEVSFILNSTNFAEILRETLTAVELEFKLTEENIVILPQDSDVIP